MRKVQIQRCIVTTGLCLLALSGARSVLAADGDSGEGKMVSIATADLRSTGPGQDIVLVTSLKKVAKGRLLVVRATLQSYAMGVVNIQPPVVTAGAVDISSSFHPSGATEAFCNGACSISGTWWFDATSKLDGPVTATAVAQSQDNTSATFTLELSAEKK